MRSHQLAQPDCAQQAGSWCARIYRLTDNDVLARYSDVVIGTGLRILLILLLAILARMLLHRAILRLTRATANGAPPGRLWPLKKRELKTREPGQHNGEQLAEADEAPPQPQTKIQAARRVARAGAVGSVLRSATTLVVYGVAFTMVLAELGINLGPIIASAGIVGVALGFGAQNLVRDFLSGMFMMIEDQYGVGDWVDLGEAKGTVEAVGMRVTTLRDTNGTVWYVRNGEVARVGNSSQGHSVAVVDVPIGHSADISAALDIAERVATELTGPDGALGSDVLETPKVLGVESIKADHVSLRITVKVRAGCQDAVQRALLAAVLAAFADAGIPPPSTADNGAPPA
ncbi:MAG TPA: mechanosensitive ion channel domain-containing protein [Pseudonocardiaceae bacterium]|nr:mechanosensitive ion channel domain-containing protein [Pseudonocardiaceae bacterium]